MKTRYFLCALWIGLSMGALSLAYGQEQITIERTQVGASQIPVAIDGFPAEVASVLRYDLEVHGFQITRPEEAQYLLSGSVGGSLIGRAQDQISKAILLNKEYTQSTTRALAHRFADDFINLFPDRKGIASSRIVFRAEAGRNSEIYIADYDGYNAVALTKDATINRDPAWVPGRRMVLYTSYRNKNPNLYAHDISNGQRRLVAGYPGLNSMPAVSPDGSRVAMILSRSGSPELYVANLDGSSLKKLTSTKEEESSPCWSPDGRSIAFISTTSGRAALYRIPSTGGTTQRVQTVGAINVTEPSWSPDGKTIAFTASMGSFQICTVPAGGGRASILAAGEDPVWASNSRTILFTRRAGARRVLSLLDVPTKRVKDTRQISGSCSQADWVR